MQRNSNVIDLYNYNDVSHLYKQLRRQRVHDSIYSFTDWLNSYKVKQKIIGLVLIIFFTAGSIIIKDPTLIFLLPICIGVMFVKEENVRL